MNQKLSLCVVNEAKVATYNLQEFLSLADRFNLSRLVIHRGHVDPIEGVEQVVVPDFHGAVDYFQKNPHHSNILTQLSTASHDFLQSNAKAEKRLFIRDLRGIVKKEDLLLRCDHLIVAHSSILRTALDLGVPYERIACILPYLRSLPPLSDLQRSIIKKTYYGIQEQVTVFSQSSIKKLGIESAKAGICSRSSDSEFHIRDGEYLIPVANEVNLAGFLRSVDIYVIQPECPWAMNSLYESLAWGTIVMSNFRSTLRDFQKLLYFYESPEDLKVQLRGFIENNEMREEFVEKQRESLKEFSLESWSEQIYSLICKLSGKTETMAAVNPYDISSGQLASPRTTTLSQLRKSKEHKHADCV